MDRTLLRLYSQVSIIIFNEEGCYVFSNINYVRPLIRGYFQPAAILIRLYFNDGRDFSFIDANPANEGSNKQRSHGY